MAAGMKGRTLRLKQEKGTPRSHSKERHTKQSSLVFLRKSQIYYTLLVGRPHQHEELGRSKKVLYTQQADKWLRLNKVDKPKWWLWRNSNPWPKSLCAL
jgi:hypothetical protein